MFAYFAFFEIEPAFIIEEDTLKQKHIALQKEWHPDFHAANTEMYAKAMEITATNNQAYRALADIVSRTAYILREYGLTGEGEKNLLPPAFLMEMMELNELIEMDPDGEADGSEAEDRLLEWDIVLKKELQEQCENADREKNKWNESYLHPLLITYQKMRYIKRLRHNLENGA